MNSNKKSILCAFGVHKFNKNDSKFVHIDDRDNKSFCRIDKKCVRCGKEISNYFYLPLL